MSETATCSKCAREIVPPAKRFRDKRGNVYCAPCAEAMRAPRQEPTGYDLADEPGATHAHGGLARDLVECPGCGGAMLRIDHVCTKCGFNRETGRRVGTADETDEPPVRKPPRRLKTVADDVKREARAAYIKPAVIILLCLPISMLIWGAIGGSPERVVVPLAVFAVMYVATLVTWFVCSVAMFGFDEPIRLEALRLGAVCSVTEIARAALSPLPGNWRIQGIVQLIIGFVFVASLMMLMEMDKEDAIIFAIIALVMRVGLSLGLLLFARQQGWI